MLHHLTHNWLQKNKTAKSDVMFITNCNIYMDYYIIFLIKNLILKNKYYAFLSNIVSSLVSISHSTLSPFSNSNKSLTKTGTVVVNEPDTCCSFVLYFNFITSFMFVLLINTIRYVNTYIYNYVYGNLYI